MFADWSLAKCEVSSTKSASVIGFIDLVQAKKDSVELTKLGSSAPQASQFARFTSVKASIELAALGSSSRQRVSKFQFTLDLFIIRFAQDGLNVC